jgi:L-asparaginase II
MLSGRGRFNSEAMRIAGADLLLKGGAEGVYCGAFPRLGLGLAIKCDDGGSRAAELVAAVMLAAALPRHAAELAVFSEVPVASRAGEPVGRVRAAAALRAFAEGLRLS